MELKQFVTAVLTEILDGVKDSQRAIEHAREGEVNPQLATNQGALQNQGRLSFSSAAAGGSPSLN